MQPRLLWARAWRSVFRRALIQGFLVVSVLGGIIACRAPLPPPTIPTPATIPATPTGSPVATLTLPTQLAIKPTRLPNWQRRWLQGIPCRAPCWEGIRPGQTTASEAADILNHSSLIHHLQIADRVTPWSNAAILTDWSDGQEDGGVTIMYPQHPVPQKVVDLDLHFSTTRHWQLQEIIAAYGEPTHILVTRGYFHDPHSSRAGNVYSLEVIYLSQGFIVGVSTGTEPPVISPTLELHDRVRFFVPTLQGLQTLAEGWDTTDLVPWQGMHSFDWYCEQASTLPNKVCQ